MSMVHMDISWICYHYVKELPFGAVKGLLAEKKEGKM